MRVVLAPDDSLPFVATSVAYYVGANRETSTTWGTAHFMEHLAFQGTEHISKAQHDTALADVGGSGDAVTNYDYTVFYAAAPASQLETLLWLDSDRMGFLSTSLDDDRVANQKLVIHEELDTYLSTPYEAANTEAVTSLYPSPHPYHGAVIGTHSDIDRVTTASLKSFIDTYYVPQNAVLVVAGMFDVSDALPLVEKYYGSIEPGEPVPAPDLTQAPTKTSGDNIELAAGASQVRLSLAWRTAPSYASDWEALGVLRQILTGGSGGALTEFVTVTKGIADAASCSLESLQGGSILRCDIYLRDAVDVAAAKKDVLSFLEDLSAKGISESQHARGLALRETEILTRQEDVRSRAIHLSIASALTGEVRTADDEVQILLSVTATDVRRVLRAHLVEGAPTTIVVRPHP